MNNDQNYYAYISSNIYLDSLYEVKIGQVNLMKEIW